VDRVVILGTTGSGKTTFSRKLAVRLDAPPVELDALHWGPDWTPRELSEFRERVRRATEGTRWIVDGNYSAVRDIVWSRADTLVWLDYPLSRILWRLLRRTMHRVLSREELWNGNRERLATAFFHRESLFFWAVKTHRRRRREYPAAFRQPAFAYTTVIRFGSPGSAERWLASVFPAASSDGSSPCSHASEPEQHS